LDERILLLKKDMKRITRSIETNKDEATVSFNELKEKLVIHSTDTASKFE
jgi:hypothetical protein